MTAVDVKDSNKLKLQGCDAGDMDEKNKVVLQRS